MSDSESAKKAPQPQFTAIPANPGWWGKIAVDGSGDPTEYVYEPVAFWLVYYHDVLGAVVDAPDAVGPDCGFGRLSELGGFQGFVYEPDRKSRGPNT